MKESLNELKSTLHLSFNVQQARDFRYVSSIFDEFLEFLHSPYESFRAVTYFAAYSDDAHSVDTCFRHISRTLLRRRVGIRCDIRVLSVSSRLSYLTSTGGIL